MLTAGFPHSAILGSVRVCRSPKLIAAYHGLRRLRVPRHPPHAFARLTTNPSSRARAIYNDVISLIFVRCDAGFKAHLIPTKRQSLVLIRFPRSYPNPLSNSGSCAAAPGELPPDCYEKSMMRSQDVRGLRQSEALSYRPNANVELTYSLLR